MKIVSMSMVGNESEIIESFIRYNSNFIDEMLLITSGCVDGTLQIINKMIQEGYNLILQDESVLSYEQRYVENKYLNLLARREDIDLIVPLDTDEFLIGKENPRDILENLQLDRVYQINWKNYMIHPEDDMNEKFIPRRLRYCKKYQEIQIAKVIIPAKLVAEKKIVLKTGRHDAFGQGLIVEKIKELELAHYPVTSKEQYISKLYGNSINFITWMNRGDGEGSHINRQILQLENGEDIYQCAAGYGIEDIRENNFEYSPINLDFCIKSELKMRYSDLSKVDLVNNLINIGQVMAVKAYNLEIEKIIDPSKPRVLVYGTGHAAQSILNGLPENLVSICAYIDRDLNKKFTMFNRRLIVPASYARFLRYDKIVIPSRSYYEEMTQTLIAEGIAREKIVGLDYLFTLV